MDGAETRKRIVEAALAHVPFDGWSGASLAAAAADAGLPPGLAGALFPRGGTDLALAWHALLDEAMAAALAREDLSSLRFRDRVAHAVMLRLSLSDREAMRRSATLFALPQNAADGARAAWSTADAIWRVLGDRSDDINWYSKRATLSATWAAVLLYWLGDDSGGHQATRDFLDRRIAAIMRFEQAKARLRASPLGRALLWAPMRALSRIRAPQPRGDLPGSTAPAGQQGDEAQTRGATPETRGPDTAGPRA